MELAFCQSCQSLRRIGKRFALSKLSTRKLQQTDETVRTMPVAGNIRNDKIIHPGLLSLTAGSVSFARLRCNMNRINTIHNGAFLYKQTTETATLLPFIHTRRRVHTVGEKTFVTHAEIEDILHRDKVPYKKGYTGYLTICKECSAKDPGNEAGVCHTKEAINQQIYKNCKYYENENIKLLRHEDCKYHENEVSKNESEAVLSLFIDFRTGDSLCRNCGVKYDWRTLKGKINLSDVSVNHNLLNPIVFKFDEQKPEEHARWIESRPITPSLKEVIESNFHLQNISVDLLEKFNVRYTDDALIFPYYDITRQHVVGFKMHDSLSNTLIVKENEHLSLFGWHLLKPEHTHVVLTANELDSIAVTMATGMPSLALPYGVSALHPDMLPYLEQFSDIILWFHDDYRAKENLQHFATKLSLSRCSSVVCNNGASFVFNEIGREEVRRCLQNRRPMSHDHIVSFKELRDDVLSALINAKQNAGVPFTRFPILNHYLKGHRRGELTIFTGPTGSGKTTFLSELSLDLCTQGVKTLWGSFEIKNVRLANVMLHQYSGMALENHIDEFSNWSQQFEKLPMYFMSYYGSQDVKRVLKTIEYAIYTYDIEHIVIDNLQFMVNMNNGEDRFQIIDNAISTFRNCATKHNVHITVVIHPRKESDGTMLQNASIYGSAKASQEADNVLILQSFDQTSMQVSKNRFSGTIGVIPLCFNPNSLCLSGFHRIVETGEAILPALKPKKIIQNLKLIKKKKTSS